jgi:hypothetical protein
MVTMGASLVRLVGATHWSDGDFRVFSPDAGAAGRRLLPQECLVITGQWNLADPMRGAPFLDVE